MRNVSAFVFCFFISATVWAQDKSAFKIDVKKYSSIDSLVKRTFLLVVDGVPTVEKPSMLNIFSIDIVNNDALNLEETYHKGIIAINTKTAVVAAYKKQFSKLSRKYKKYLLSHQNNDRDIMYVLNGVPLADDDEIIARIHDSLQKLESVNFIKSNIAKGVYGTPRPVLIISTNK